MLALVFITAIQLSGLLLSDCLKGRNFSSWVQRTPPSRFQVLCSVLKCGMQIQRTRRTDRAGSDLTAARTYIDDYCTGKVQGSQSPTYSHNAEEKVRKREKKLSLFLHLIHLHQNSPFCPQCCMHMISLNAPEALPLHGLPFLVTDHEDDGACTAVCVLR